MSPRFLIRLFVVLACASLLGPAHAQEAQARPGGPLVCHKEVCPLPTSSCQVREADRCLHGGGPPRCPAIVNVVDGTACNDGSICTAGDACRTGVCVGVAVTCSSTSDVCTPSTGCATACGPAGCVVAAAGGYLNPTLTIPAGALSAPVSINMTDLGPDVTNASVYRRYNFAPSGTTFAIPATVDLPAPPLIAGQTAVIEVSNDGTNWQAVATTLNAGRVSGPITHFSQCRTRATVAPAAVGLLILDAVSYQDVATPSRPTGLVIPPSGESGSCYSGDFHGTCIKLSNPTNATITSSCPVPTPSPAPPGCQQLRVVPWQCYAALRNFPAPFDPGNPTLYEGQRCDRAGGFLISCPQTVYNLEQLAPSGIPANTDLWVDLNFRTLPPAGGANPLACFGSTFVGFDLLFREPSGSCPAGGGSCDWQAGIRSAKLGPFISVSMGTPLYLPPGQGGCPAGGATCVTSCGAATCQVEWEWLVNRPANYPTLRFTPSGTAIKNWLLDTRE
jgi:hypothetical protein